MAQHRPSGRRLYPLLTGAFVLPVMAMSTLSCSAPVQAPCVARRAVPPTGPAVVQEMQRSVAGDARLTDVTLYSPALAGKTHVLVLVPPGYDPSGRTRYPVLYLLHGVGGDDTSWTAHGAGEHLDAASLSGGRTPFITVMPDGGRYGFYTDWYGTPGKHGVAPAWATYHVNELIPWVDATYPTIASRGGRAIAGLSMGGFGAMTYAAHHPDLFAAAGSFSGAVSINHRYPYANDMLVSSSLAGGDGAGRCIWGDPHRQVQVWRAADPTLLASNLRGVSVYVASGNGRVGPLDDPGQPSTYATQRLEQFVWPMNQAFDGALTSAGVFHVADFYGDGTHTWAYWLRDLDHFLPQMDAAFRTPPAAAPGAQGAAAPAHFAAGTTGPSAPSVGLFGWLLAGAAVLALRWGARG